MSAKAKELIAKIPNIEKIKKQYEDQNQELQKNYIIK
jgi:hypothetical protein